MYIGTYFDFCVVSGYCTFLPNKKKSNYIADTTPKKKIHDEFISHNISEWKESKPSVASKASFKDQKHQNYN